MGFSVPQKDCFTDTVIPAIKKVSHVYTTHSYLLTHDIYDLLILNIEKSHLQIDVCYTNFQKNENIYGIFPALVTQTPSYSDIQNKFTDYSVSIKFIDHNNKINHVDNF